MAIPSRAIGQRGFALLIVLWTLVLISFLIAHLSASGSTELRIAGNLSVNAGAREAADGAIYDAVFELAGGSSAGNFPIDGSSREIRIGGSTVAVRAENEAAWINPNAASPGLVAALLRVLGLEPRQAADIAGAIAEWVGKPALPVSSEISLADRLALADYHPPRAPLETLDELAHIRGVTPEIADLLRPHLTLFGPALPDPATPDPQVAAAIALSGQAEANTTPAITDRALTVRVHAAARGPGNASITRTAVLRVDAGVPGGYAVLAWNDGDEPLQ